MQLLGRHSSFGTAATTAAGEATPANASGASSGAGGSNCFHNNISCSSNHRILKTSTATASTRQSSSLSCRVFSTKMLWLIGLMVLLCVSSLMNNHYNQKKVNNNNNNSDRSYHRKQKDQNAAAAVATNKNNTDTRKNLPLFPNMKQARDFPFLRPYYSDMNDPQQQQQPMLLLTLEDFKDLGGGGGDQYEYDEWVRKPLQKSYEEEPYFLSQVVPHRQPFLNLLADAQVANHLNVDLVRSLPTVRQFQDLYGGGGRGGEGDTGISTTATTTTLTSTSSVSEEFRHHQQQLQLQQSQLLPVIVVGMETCESFRNSLPLSSYRYVGVAGQMNSGTSALSRYLHRNLKMVGNQRGILSNGVPWMKHSWSSLRSKHLFSFPDQHEQVLPVIVIRDPYFWMQSMCESPYQAQWHREPGHCPNLVNYTSNSNKTATDDTTTPTNSTNTLPSSIPVEIRYDYKNTYFRRKWPSLVHMWNDWYREYVFQADYPRLIVRFEDVLANPRAILQQVQQCAGAEWKHPLRKMVYVTGAVKDNDFFRQFKEQGGMISGLIKYGKDEGRRTKKMNALDLEFARQNLDQELMRLFQYRHPDGDP